MNKYKLLFNWMWAVYLSCALCAVGHTIFTKEFWLIFVPTFILVFVFKYNDLINKRNEWNKLL